MLFFMGSASHLTGLLSGQASYGAFFAIMLVIVLLAELNAFVSNPLQRLLGSVSGTIHAGVALTVILYIVASVLL